MRSPFPPRFDGPRPLRPGFAERLESELSSVDVVTALSDLDAPRPLPADLDARLEASLAVGPAVPVRLRRRLVRSVRSAAPRPAGTGARWSVAALLLFVLGASSVAFVTGTTVVPGEEVADQSPDGGGGPGRSGRSGGLAPLVGPPAEEDVVGGGRPGRGRSSVRVVTGTGSESGAASGAAESQVRILPEDRGPRPPFAFGPMADAPVSFGSAAPVAGVRSGSVGPSSKPPPADLRPVRIGVVEPESEFGEGFRAYVRLLNRSGGVRGQRFEVLPTSAPAPAADVLAVVNGSASALATDGGPPKWVRGPLLEHPRAPEEALTGSVFSLVSVLERQAHLAVLGAFPEPPPPSARPVVYRQDGGAYGQRVAAAMESALDQMGAMPVTVAFDPANPVLVPGATAAFLALDAPDARAFLAAAKKHGYAPEGGIWGVESLFDTSLVPLMTEHVRVASPFTPASLAELDAVTRRAGQFTAEILAGWVAAKATAVAVWRSGASTPAQLTEAMQDLPGWRTPFLDRYEVRKGTTSRTPEAVTLRVEDGVFRPVGDFRRDPL